MTKVFDNIVGLRDMTTEEQAQYDKDLAEWNSKSADRKLEKIRLYRNRRLKQQIILLTLMLRCQTILKHGGKH